MAARNLLLDAPPYVVEQTVIGLGRNLRTARLRRNLTIEQVAQKIGTGPRAVMDAEKGKLSTSVAVYAALLWTYDLLQPLSEVADPAQDSEGLTLDRLQGRERARAPKGLDNDF
ncbi:helix-turn-helix domain-containing protein [Novosphingobium sp.]|uniref:helix-turn-helix domain-containing protein n=1 Tax=Novosphingobium sp. TaxID=1874826 RepID=UPI0035B3E159